jgi:hypothetical protein
MPVELHLYFEVTPSGPVWWSESPEVPEFHATAPHLQELIIRSELALIEILDTPQVELKCRLVGDPPGTVGDPLPYTTGEIAKAVTTGVPSILVGGRAA